MYADFFLDRLCNAAPVLTLFKRGLETIDGQWPDIDLVKDKLDPYAIALNFFDTLNHNFNNIELQYICHALYAQAGAAESISYITTVCGEENLNIKITESLLPTGRFYEIKVSSTHNEYINNFQLFKQKLEELVRDLLYYNGLSLGLYSLYFDFPVINKSYLAEQVHIVNDKYALLPANILDNDAFVIADLGED